MSTVSTFFTQSANECICGEKENWTCPSCFPVEADSFIEEPSQKLSQAIDESLAKDRGSNEDPYWRDSKVEVDDGFTVVTKRSRTKGNYCKRDLERFCKECNSPFVFTVEKQLEYKEKKWNLPKTCGSCRHKRVYKK